MADNHLALTQSMTPKMVAFVEHYVAYGGRHQGRAAIMAGYAKSSADVVASRLLRRPDVLALLRHIVETRIKADAVASADTLRELRDSPATPAAVRRQCANDLLDRAGMLVERFATVRHITEVQPVVPDISRLVQTFMDLAPDMGIDVVIRDQAKFDWFKQTTNARFQQESAMVIEGGISEDGATVPENADGA